VSSDCERVVEQADRSNLRQLWARHRIASGGPNALTSTAAINAAFETFTRTVD